MADKSFGVKKIELLGDGTPTIESPNDLNLNANTVAISTNLSVGNRVSVSSGVVTSISGVVTYYGDGQYLTGLTASPNVVGTSLSISGISTLGVTSVTDLTAQDLDVSGIASVGTAITMYGATGIISATQFYGDGSKLTGIGAATTANIIAETLKVTGVSTLGVTTITDNFFVSGVSTFSANANTLNVSSGTTNAAINIQFSGDTKGSLSPKSDGLEIGVLAGSNLSMHLNNNGSNTSDFIVKSNGSQLFKIDAGDVKSTFSSDVNVGSAITMYQATGIVSATKFYGDGSNLSGIGTQNDNINAIDGTFSGIVTASAFAGHGYLQAPYGSTVTFTVTVAGKDATHRYNGTGSGNGYLINGVQAPILTLTPGRTYRFTNDNTGSHPFKFYYKADKTTEYTTGVSFQNAYTEITVSDTTPNVLHYQCTAHAYMGNAVVTNSNVVDSPYPATLRDGLSVTGISNVGSAITMYGATGIISATKFIGDGSSLTGITADTLGDLATLKVTGLSTFNGNVDVNADVDISGNLSIGGTLTYEDVTNVDSIGLITARGGIAVLGSGVTVTGLSTFYSDLNVGSAITMLSSSGIVSATKFFGDGSSLSGISADTIGDLSKLVVTGIATFQSNIGVAGSVTTDLLHVGYSTSLALAYNYNPSVQQVGTDNSSSTLGIFRFSADASAPSFRFIKSRSSDPSGKGIVQNGDELGTIFFIGDDGNDFANGGAAIKATVDGAPSATADMPTKLSFHTAVDGSAFARERLTIRNTGDVGIGTIDPTGTGALTTNDAVLAVGVVTATKFYGDGSNLTGVGGGTSPGQVAFASTAGISTLTSSWTVVPNGSSDWRFNGPGNLTNSDDPTIYLQRGQVYEFVIDSSSSHPFQIRKTDNTAYTDGVTYTGSGSGSNTVYDGTVRFDVPFDAPAQLKYVCTNHAGDMVGIIYVTDAAGQGGPTDVADFQNLKVSAASTLGSVKVSSGIVTAVSGIVTFYGDGQYLTGITAEGTGAIGGLTVKDEGSTVGTAGSVATLNFVGDGVVATATAGAAGVATVTIPGFSPTSGSDGLENLRAGTGAGANVDADTCFNLMFGCNAGATLNEGDGNVLLGCNSGCCITSGSYNLLFGSTSGRAVTTGRHNIAMGQNAMSRTPITGSGGDCNIALGYYAGCSLGGSSRNIFLGACAAKSATGYNNIALGYNVELPNAAGNCQLAIGDDTNRWIAGDSSFNVCLAGIATVYASTGIVSATKFCGDGSALTGTKFDRNDDDNNLFAGVGAGGTYTGGSTSCYNLALGYAAMGGLCNDTGGTTHNITFGLNSGYSLSGGDNNFLGGYESGKVLTSGCRNIFIGRSAGRCQTTTTGNIYLGECAGIQPTGAGIGGNYNIGIGYQAGAYRCTSNSTCNITIGYQAGYSGRGFDNIALGKHALYGGTFCGCFNIGIGDSTGYNLADGKDNTLLGRSAGYNAEDGSDNVAIGRLAGYNIKDADDNVFVGQRAGVWTCNGCRNVMLGGNAGGSDSRSSYSTGNYNQFIGYCAGALTCAGIANVFLGPFVGGTNSSGSYNIGIGAEVCLPSATGSCQLAIGKGSDRWITGDSSFNVCLAGSNIKAINSGGVFCATKFVGDGSSLTGIVTATGISTTTTSTFNDLTVTGVSTFLGSVGIGTTNSNHYNLRVDAGAAKSAFQVVGSTGTLLDVVNDATSDIFSANDVSGINAFKINKDRLITMSLVGAGDSVGIGTTLPRSSSKLDVEGIVKATSFLGDGSTLTGVGFNADSAESLYAGTDAGKCAGSSNCFNVAIGYKAGCCIGKSSSQGDDNVFIGCCAGASNASGLFNTFIGNGAGKANTSGHYNVMLGREAGSSTDGGGCNVFLGVSAGGNNAAGDRNIGIGYNVCLPSTSGDDQLAIGSETNRWIAGDSSFNVTLAGIATAYATTGIVSATKFCGDGSALTGISAGFTPDSYENLIAGTEAGAAVDNDTCYSVILGYRAAKAWCDGSGSRGSVYIGNQAGCALHTGSFNTFVGTNVGQTQTSGSSNTYIGRQIMHSGANTGSYNLYIGEEIAGASSNTTGEYNLSLGYYSHYQATTASMNIAIGLWAGHNVTTGGCNVFIGKNAGNGDSTNYVTGSNNTIVGAVNTGNKITSGTYNALFGARAGMCLTSGGSNTFIGRNAGGGGTVTGDSNVAVGRNAGNKITSGANNIFLGSCAGCFSATGNCNIAIGAGVTFTACNGSGQLAIGVGATHFISGDSSYNVTLAGIATVTKSTGVVEATKFCGDGSCLTGLPGFSPDAQGNLYAGTAAGAASDADTCFNVALGNCAGCSLNEGDHNVLLGNNPARTLTSGSCNIIIGKLAAMNRTSGSESILIGTQAGVNKNSFRDISIGSDAGYGGCSGATGADNISIGHEAGYGQTTAGCNVFIGAYTGKCTSTGSHNFFVGTGAAAYGVLTGDRNIVLGRAAAERLAGGVQNVYIGAYAARCMGYTGGNNVVLGTNAMRGSSVLSDNIAANNVVLGQCAGYVITSGSRNFFGGYQSGCNVTSGSRNVMIGAQVQAASATGDCQLAIGNGSDRWIEGDSSFNVTLAGIATATASGGIFEATKFCGDGSCLTGLAGWTQTSGSDGVGNLYAGDSAGAASDSGTCYNIGVGCNALKALNGGDLTIAIGCDAGCSLTSGFEHILIGYKAGASLTTCWKNTLIGHGSGKSQTTGVRNTYLGLYTGYCNITGSNNVYMGNYTAKCMCSGSNNIALGSDALCGSTTHSANTGSSNIALGQLSLSCVSGGSHNIAIGSYAGKSTTGGSYNLMFGKEAGCKLTTALNNVLIGAAAGRDLNESGCKGAGNVFIGDDAGKQLDCACVNVIIGKSAADSTDDIGKENVIIGCMAARNAGSNMNCSIIMGPYAGRCASGSNNIYLGMYAGRGKESTANDNAGSNNVAIGYNAGKDLKSGAECNISIGRKVMGDNGAGFTGGNNVALGAYNLRYATSANYNIALGSFALENSRTGACNIALGTGTLRTQQVTGSTNVALGKDAGYAVSSGSDNIAIGCKALGTGTVTGQMNITIGREAGTDITSGSYNILFGRNAARGITSGSSNIAMGTGTLGGDSASTVTTGSGNIVFGELSGVGATSAACNILIGSRAGKCITEGQYNIFLGNYTGATTTTGDFNIMLGKGVCASSATADRELAIGCASSRWICGDSSFNVTIAGIATVSSATGIVSATKFCGDGSALTGLAGFSQDSQGNLVAGTGAGAAKDADTCFNIILGCNAGLALNEGDHNIIMGCHAGCAMTSSTDNVALGRCAMCGHTTGHSGNGKNIAIGVNALADSNCFDNIGIGALAGCGKSGETISYKKSIFIGSSAGAQTAAGICNIFIGQYAGKGNDTGGISGNDNIAVGQDAGCTISSGSCNIFMGKLAGKQLTTGSFNVITGPSAGSNAAITGTYNNLYGYQAGYNVSSGQRNSAFGNGALYGLTTGRCNVAMGSQAGYVLTEGCANIAIGVAAGCKISTGDENIAIGNGALNTGTVTGDANIAIGSGAAKNVTSALCNIAIGMGAMCTATDGCCNVSIGIRAGRCLTSGDDNVFLGFYAGENVTTGSDNVYVGKSAGPLTAASSADHNVAIGLSPGHDLTTGCCNVFIGYKTAQGNTTGYANVYLGACAGPISGTDSSGYYNFATGWRAGKGITSGRHNIIMGVFAGQKITTGKYNVVFGEEAMAGNSSANMTGSNNFTVGKASSYNLTTGQANFVFGHYALNKSSTGSYNIAIGQASQQSRCTGDNNISLGAYSLYGHATGASDSTGQCNIAIGACAGKKVCTGNNNTFIGYRAGCDIETGSMNIMIGCSVDGSGVGVDKEIVLGYTSSGVGKGTRTFYVQSDAGVYHGGNTTTWSTTSDLRIKKNVTDNNTGLDKIKEVQVRNFEYRTKDEITDFENPSAVVVNKEGLQLGVIAQEIQQVLPDTVTQQSTGALSVNADNLTWYLINAVKELSEKNDALEARIKKLEES